MSQLTQRRVGRSDNNEAGKTPYIDASMVRRMGQCLYIGPVGIFQRFIADVPTGGNMSTGLICRVALCFLQISAAFTHSGISSQ
jgi:hypothetical protein